MQTAGLHVAIVHRQLALGGAEEVSRQTSLLFSSMGIHTHFFAEGCRPSEWKLPDDPRVSLTLLPEGIKLWSRASADYLLQTLQREGIWVLIIPIALDNPQLHYLRSSGLRIVYWCHSSPLWELVDRRERARYKPHHPWYKNLYSLTARRLRLLLTNKRQQLLTRYQSIILEVDCFITLSPDYIETFAHELGLSETEVNKLVALPNMVTPPVPPLSPVVREKKIIFMGRLSYADKRADRVVTIWERVHELLPDWSVEIYGAGSERRSLEQLLQRKKLPRISLRGYATSPSEIYPSASVLMMTSTYEGWGLVLTEAQSYGTVPIAFACSAGVTEIIGADCRYGRLVSPFDIEEYATKLVELCQDEDLRLSLSEACRLRSLDFLPERNIPRWRAIFAKL